MKPTWLIREIMKDCTGLIIRSEKNFVDLKV